METHPTPRIILADRLQGGIIVSFEDGTSAIYSAELLQAMTDRARLVTVGPSDDAAEFGAQ
jgi:hypothetical protein